MALAAVATVGVARYADIQPTAVEFLLVFVGALTPDIDGEGSILRPGSILRRLVPRFICTLLDMIGETVGALVGIFTVHRGFFHWPVLVFALFALGYFLESDALGWFALGYATHLAGDAVTAGGIPIFAPLSREPTGLPLFTTGARVEGFVFIGLTATALYFGYPFLPGGMRNAFADLDQYLGCGFERDTSRCRREVFE